MKDKNLHYLIFQSFHMLTHAKVFVFTSFHILKSFFALP